MKVKLRNNLMNIDNANNKIIGIDKFDIECKELGIRLSQDDLHTIINLYQENKAEGAGAQIPTINYNNALQALVPVIQKNTDKKVSND